MLFLEHNQILQIKLIRLPYYPVIQIISSIGSVLKNISKQMIISNIKSKKSINSLDIYIYACYFNINIFTFDFEENEIVSYYQDTEYNIYKKNVFISKMGNQYNPLTYKNDNGRLFKHNSSILEDVIYNSEIKPFTLNEKEFVICNDWDILLKKYENKDLSNIIIDIDEEKSLLLKQMIDSDDSDSIEESLNENIDYDSDDVKSENPDFENLTEELEIINKATNDMQEVDSDDMNLCSSSENEVEIKNSIVDINLDEKNNEMLEELKAMSKNKLSKEKKDVLLNYLITIFNKEKSKYEKSTKAVILDSLYEELNKEI